MLNYELEEMKYAHDGLVDWKELEGTYRQPDPKE
jgi:hypothetical protein